MAIKRNPFSILVMLGLSCLVLLFMSACGGDETEGDEDAETDVTDDSSEATEGVEDDAQDAESEEEGIVWEEFAVTRAAPNHGPFSGGTPVLVRGRGFEDGALVYFGEHMVQLPDTVFIDDNRIQVRRAPAGSPGPVDVKVVMGEEEAVLEDGYTYDVFYVSPASGSVAGGTYVEITGHDTNFQPGSSITFDGEEAVDVDWVSEIKMTCRTPMGSIGPANVIVEGPDDDFETKEAYNYYNSTDPINGGLGGGPIDGAVNVTILNAMSGEPVEDAFCILGTSGETVYQGLTNTAGQITFSGPDLSGRQIVTASKEEFEATTIEEFDAKDVTIFLVPTTISMGPGEPPPPRLGATVHGELVFEHSGEFGPGPWEIVPDPGPNEEKVAYVYGTGYDFLYPPPNPGLGGAHCIVKEDYDAVGEHGFLFSVFVRPENVAVYAVAGLQNLETATFVPYAFGVARGIIAGPGEDIEGVLVYMTHELNQSVTLEMQEYYVPLDLSYGPELYKSELFIDLGGDGVVFRDDRTIIKKDVSDFFYPGWLPLRYELADASYTAVLGSYNTSIDELTGDTIYVNPFSVKIMRDVTHPWEPVIMEEFIGVPYPVDPAYGSQISGMHMEFGNLGAEPDFWLAMLQTYPDQIPIWKIFLPGTQTEYDLPDLALIAGLPEPPSGFTVWIVWGISADGFIFDELSYRYLYSDYWSAYTADAFIFEY